MSEVRGEVFTVPTDKGHIRDLTRSPIHRYTDSAGVCSIIRAGHDPQLEKAVEVVLEELAKHPAAPAGTHPPFPDNHSG